ncbi:MAG: InlB B-repeat-containing protein [Clostridia bacterium]|nr:InlB B-repeat-containing protein [Clostridia bacterium]
MKKLVSCVSLLLCFLMLVPCLPVSAIKIANVGAPSTDAVNADVGVSPSASYSYNGYTTYTDYTLRWKVPTTTEGGNSCPSMQGMNTGINNCYVAKRDSTDTYVGITRINMNTGATTVMKYYSSESATSATGCNCLGHANELSVVTIDGTNYMFGATAWYSKALTRLKISGTKLIFTGYFDLVNTSGDSVNITGVRHIKTEGGYLYFLIKRGLVFYYCKIAENETGGPASNPTKVTMYKIFNIETRNAVFAKSNSSAGTITDIDTWTNQGFGYNATEKVLYIPIWDSASGYDNAIITYYLGDELDRMFTLTTNQSTILYPTKTTFRFTDSSLEKFEIESCNFRVQQAADGDHKLYFNTNNVVSTNEGVYSCSYTTGKGDFTCLANESSVLWTTKYNANGGTGTTSTTYHIRGITTKLRTNGFTRDGYTFAGWYLTRKSDGKWLYFDTDGTARWYTKGTQPAMSILALYEDKRSVSKLATTDGDTVTCYAQWIPNSTGTNTFYIRYDGNGGTGTMSDTKVVYGTSTATTPSTFVREGYVFTGWNAYRQNKAQWCYKVIDGTTISDSWLTVADSASGSMRKTYSNGCKLAKSSSVDRDIVTFYASWSRVADGVYPVSHYEGDPFTLGGAIESTTDMYTATVQVKDSAGAVVASHTATPMASSYDLALANADISFDTLPIGSYTYEVSMTTLDSATPLSHTLLSTAFNIIDPMRLILTSVAEKTGAYTLGDKYFRGFNVNTNATELSALFEYGVTVTSPAGTAVNDTTLVGTGYVISCGDESRTTVLTGDLNCDAAISSADIILLASAIKGGFTPDELVTLAADGDFNGDLSSSDAMVLKMMLK